jgi:Class III cytochrome C family
MKDMFRSWWDLVVRYRKPLTAIGLGVLGIIVVANAFFYGVAYFPKSCVVCHYMDPFYAQWKTSKHAGVPCIKCHSFSPVANTVNTVKYWTGMYNPRPHANVQDAACLAKGCHEGRIERGKARLGANIIFDHQEHLGKLKRGEKLRCTSCHYSIVQGEHIAVDTNVCFLCHFKGISQGQALGGCPGCHGAPTRPVEHGGFVFSHASYLKVGVQCKQCHSKVAEGAGAVADARCYDCHVGRLAKKSDPLAIHRTHVTFNAIMCFKCHDRIAHGEVQLVKTFEVKCDSCHKKLHNYQKEMYMGTGARGVADTPSRMFSAQVACDGCHTRAVDERAGQAETGEKKLTAERQSCVTCHGKKYDLMLDDWVRESRVLVADMGRLVAAGQAAVGSGKAASKKVADARALVADASANLLFLRAGHGAHNIEYAYKIVRAGFDQVTTAYKLVGAGGAPPRPAILSTPSSYCTALCHGRVGAGEKVFFKEMELQFPHRLHVSDVGIECAKCHSPEKHKLRIVTRAECMKCHHESKDIECGHCHKAQKDLYEGKVKAVGVTVKADVMASAGTKCVECHDLKKGAQTVLSVKAKCVECHSEKYGKMLVSWKEEITAKENAIAVSLDDAKGLVARSRKSGKNVDADEALLKQAEANYQIVTNGRGTHNYSLSRDLLKAAQANIDRIRKERSAAK